MHKSTLAELSVALESKKISSEELTQLYIERCKKHNNSLNCFITITEEEALKKAKEADIGEVYVATEDKEILDDIHLNGGKAI